MTQNRIIADSAFELRSQNAESLLTFQSNCLQAIEYTKNTEDKAVLISTYNILQRELNARKPEWATERCEGVA